MKRLAAAIGFLASIAVAQAEEPFAKERQAWNLPAAPFHIIGNVYYVGTTELSVYLIATPRGLILIDEGLPESVKLIEKNITALGFKLKDVKILIAGHAHFDHVGGLAELKKHTHATVVAMAADKPFLESGHITFGPSESIAFEPVKVDRAVRDDETVELGGSRLIAHGTAGHTPGCTSWSLPVEEAAISHNVLFACSITVAGNPLVSNAAYPKIAADYRSTFAKLKAMKIDVLLTEHQRLSNEIDKAARVKPGTPNPFVDNEELKRYAEAAERDFEAEYAKQSAKH